MSHPLITNMTLCAKINNFPKFQITCTMALIVARWDIRHDTFWRYMKILLDMQMTSVM